MKTYSPEELNALVKKIAIATVDDDPNLLISALAAAMMFTICQVYPKPANFKLVIDGVMKAMQKDALELWKKKQEPRK